MPLCAKSPKFVSSRLPSPSKKKTCQPRRSTKRQNRHSWTDEELNLLSYLRHLRRWRFSRIQKAHFPSLSSSALLGAYWRLSTEERERRASVVAAPIITLRNTATDSRRAFNAQSTQLGLENESSFSQAESNTETSILRSRSSATGDGPVAKGNHKSRYNLRPHRPTIFPQRGPRCKIDQRRFPHFSKSYRYHMSLHRLPDRDYVPLSHPPTPDLSDRSPSVVSSQPSVVSSLELFGLEACSPTSSHRGSPSNSRPSDEVSSAEYFSSEEHPFTS
jgi:hypothetical protein